MATVILLNGVGSAGKSSLARELQGLARRPFLYVAMDAFLQMLPAAYADHAGSFAFQSIAGPGGVEIAITTGPVGTRLMQGMRGAVAALADAGNDLIVDEVMLGGEAADYRSRLASHDLKLVGLVAPLDVLERRERQRGDRQIGLARWQFGRVHRGVAYDLVVDTAIRSARAGAELVRDRFDL